MQEVSAVYFRVREMHHAHQKPDHLPIWHMQQQRVRRQIKGEEEGLGTHGPVCVCVCGKIWPPAAPAQASPNMVSKYGFVSPNMVAK